MFKSSKISKGEWYELFVIVANRIAAYLGLKTKIKEIIGNGIVRFSCEKGLDVYIKADKEEKSIILGTDFTFVDNFDN